MGLLFGRYQFLFTNFFNVEKKQLINYPATSQYLITQGIF